jgi:hypothetical protein
VNFCAGRAGGRAAIVIVVWLIREHAARYRDSFFRTVPVWHFCSTVMKQRTFQRAFAIVTLGVFRATAAQLQVRCPRR